MKYLSKFVLWTIFLLWATCIVPQTQAQTAPSLSPALEWQLSPIIERVYNTNKTEFNEVKARLEKYVTDASEDNTKRKIAADIHVLMQKMDVPKTQIPTLTQDQTNILLNHLPSVPADRGILILEFSDLQCPFCARHHNNETLEDVVSTHPYASSYFFDFPLSFHQQANPGAIMRQCVQRYAWYESMKWYVWKAFETAFSTSDAVTQSLYNLWFEDALQDKILDCYTSQETQKWVTSQMDLWKSLGVTGTPWNIVIDRYTKQYLKISGAVPASSFDKPLMAMRNGDTSIYPSTAPVIRYIQPEFIRPQAVKPWAIPTQAVPVERTSTINESAYTTFKNGAPLIYSSANAKISIIEFSDFQCPFCQRHNNNGTLETVQAKYGEDVNVYFWHFPLWFHANAQKAWEAYECANEQWGAVAFKKAYFAAGGDSNMDIAKKAAIDSGLDAEALMTCVESGKYRQKVQNHMAFGQSLWVTWTPGNIVINNETGEYTKISWAVPATSFDNIITAIKNGETINALTVPTIIPTAATKLNPETYSDFLETIYIEWDTNAKVSIIEFSDFQCPFCQRHANNWTLNQVQEKYGEDVNLIFAHYPLWFHANAQKAAEAVECSIEQWDVLAFLAFKKAYFAKWGDSNLDLAKEVATEMWLDPNTLMDCINSGKYTQKVKNHMEYGKSLWVTWTPWNIVVNNETLEFIKVSGAVPTSAFDISISSFLWK